MAAWKSLLLMGDSTNIVMHVAQLLRALVVAPDHEIIETSLPEVLVARCLPEFAAPQQAGCLFFFYGYNGAHS
jgi:hypothetical protein